MTHSGEENAAGARESWASEDKKSKAVLFRQCMLRDRVACGRFRHPLCAASIREASQSKLIGSPFEGDDMEALISSCPHHNEDGRAFGDVLMWRYDKCHIFKYRFRPHSHGCRAYAWVLLDGSLAGCGGQTCISQHSSRTDHNRSLCGAMCFDGAVSLGHGFVTARST